MTDRERVEEVRLFFKFNKKTFSEVLGYTTPQSYTSYLNGSNNLSMKMIKAIIKHDSKISIDWILKGQGQMLLNNKTSSNQKKIYGDGNTTQIGHNNELNSNSNNNSNAIENDFLKSKIELLENSLKDKDERLKDKEELITMLKKNQK